MADKPAKPIDNARYKEGKVSYSQNRYECKHIRLYAYLPHTHIYVYIYICLRIYYEIKLIHALHVMETNGAQWRPWAQ